MSHPERGFRRITSIPTQTPLDVLRGGITIRIGRGGVPGGAARRVSRGPIVDGEPDWKQIVARHVFKNPPIEKRAVLPNLKPRIEWEVGIMEDYNGKGDLGVILQFSGIRLTEAPFVKSRHNRSDAPVFYIPIGHDKSVVRLFLATRGDIFEAQIAPAQMDVNPLFREELYLSQLATTYDPTHMTVTQNNGLITVSYNPCTPG